MKYYTTDTLYLMCRWL